MAQWVSSQHTQGESQSTVQFQSSNGLFSSMKTRTCTVHKIHVGTHSNI